MNASQPWPPSQPGVTFPAGGSQRRPLARFSRGEESPSFYLSLSDLMSLLLVFFVLIFSLAELGRPVPAAPPAALPKPGPAPPQGPGVLAAGSMPLVQVAPPGTSRRLALAPRPALLKLIEQSRPFVRPVPAPAPAAPPAASRPVAASPPVRRPALARQMARALAGSGARLDLRQRRLVILLPSAILFDTARAEIKQSMADVLRRISKVVARYPSYQIVITGHTDNRPINNARFASNWELSAARAAAVARALQQRVAASGRFTIRGMAASRPRAPNDSPSHRALNRRVEIEMRPLKG